MANFTLGVFASLVATFIWYAVSLFVSYRRMAYLGGYWFQEIPTFGERRYSIGRFSYNKYSRSFTFDGTNFNLNGKPVCDWESVNLYTDFRARKILYTFRGNLREETYTQFYGFGVMNLENDQQGRLVPIKGFFQDAQEASSPQTFVITKLDEMAESLGVAQGSRSIEDFHSYVIRQYHSQRNNT